MAFHYIFNLVSNFVDDTVITIKTKISTAKKVNDGLCIIDNSIKLNRYL